jgi:hypothetical protein
METLSFTSPIPIGRACSNESGRYETASVRVRRIDRANGESVQYADATNGHMLVRTVVASDAPLDRTESMIGRKAIGAASKAGKPQLLVRCGDVFNIPGSSAETAQKFPDVSSVGPIVGDRSSLEGSIMDVRASALRQLLESIEDRSDGKRSSDAQVVRIHVPSDARKPLRFMSSTMGGAPILAMMMPIHSGDTSESATRFPKFAEDWNSAWSKGERR